MEKLYLSTAIPYVNYPPHIGFALEIIQADVIARYNRLSGKEVFFLTGTDEHSIKNVKTAIKEGIEVKKLVNLNAKKFYQLKSALNLSFDDFIRTTQERHIKGAKKLWLACKKDIYKKKYKGLYCSDCEEFYKERELVNGLCPEHKIKPEIVEEENYFFRLSNYQKSLKEAIEKDKIKIIPEKRKNEILNFIHFGLEDICISRSNKRAQGWGIDVPGDPSQKLWVWIDALSNYITALGYGENKKEFQEWWQGNENKLHIIGKGILRFHALYWPAFLLSAKISLPKTIFVHGYITVEGKKMSKTLGNVVDPFELVEKYGRDSVRYYLLREISPIEDGDFSYQKFEKRYEADLAKGLGNLVSRVIALKKEDIAFSQSFSKKKILDSNKEYKKALDNFQFNYALEIIWKKISNLDKKIDKERPWALPSPKLKKILIQLFENLKEISYLLEPLLPETSEKILKNLTLKSIKKTKPLFPKLS
jgi:methionyl-tRNA synthetase